jgi:hypothetical protein
MSRVIHRLISKQYNLTGSLSSRRVPGVGIARIVSWAYFLSRCIIAAKDFGIKISIDS